MGGGVAAHENAPGQQLGHAYDSAEGDGKELRRQSARSLQVQSLPTEFGPGGDHNNESGVAGRKPAETTMEADVACFDHEHKRGRSKQREWWRWHVRGRSWVRAAARGGSCANRSRSQRPRRSRRWRARPAQPGDLLARARMRLYGCTPALSPFSVRKTYDNGIDAMNPSLHIV
jgi:hypothetical protein